MKFCFRWFGKEDPIPLIYIRQIPVIEGIVSALYDVPVGDVWPRDKINVLKKEVEAQGLEFTVIESIPVHEDIKIGKASREKYIDNYCQSVRNMGELEIPILCYNIMPVFDWMRTNLEKENPDGSTSLSYDHSALKEIDLRKEALDLPGWATAYTHEELEELLDAYSKVDENKLWINFEYFLKQVVPIAEESGVKMAIHIDDPPWSIFNLPRIIKDEKGLDRLVNAVDSTSNGISFCVGSLGANMHIELPRLIRKYGKKGRIHFAHLRNIKHTSEYSFYETPHPTKFGDNDMHEIMKALIDIKFEGAIRPDHGRMIWGEKGRPGYGLYDRALGSMYLYGLWEGLQKSIPHTK
ncbi:MAG: Mannonate dehydratase [Promethearchaeota archaeon]|nr:MAG: Mannonate dehydratase [Candidatus Lokiarchaeota archaeon]